MESEPNSVKALWPAGIARWLGRIGTGMLNQIYPPTCLACGAGTVAADALCPACFAQLRPITAPYCPVLGIPFAVSLGEGARSAEAIAEPPNFNRARAAVIYNDIARAVVAQLKYADRPELSRFCARGMARAGAEFWAARPALVPVPLHPIRQLERRFNQSTELARALGRILDLPVDAGLLRRTRRTRQQVGLSGDQRRRNVQGAFATHPAALERVKGRPVVLIDDVLTTGATLRAATAALHRGGIDTVDALTFARVVNGEGTPI